MRTLICLALISLLLPRSLRAEAGDIHGPICSWHLDPTSTMTIQWIEHVNLVIPGEKWWEGTSGFGYGDNDDETTLDMQDEYQRLYIRIEFEEKDLPTVPEIDVTGRWKATTKIDEKDFEFDVVFDSKEDKLTGTIALKDAPPTAFNSGYVSGRTVHVSTEYSLLRATYTVEMSATAKDGKLEGHWRALDKEGKEVARENLTLERLLTEEEKKAEQAKSEEQKNKEAEEEKKSARNVVKADAFEMQLRIRFDDAFIAYLNGVEIHREGIEEGRGKNAKGIKGHNADKEEVFVIDRKFNRFLTTGQNILAIEGHNAQLDSSDFTLDPKFWIKVDKKELKSLNGKDTWQFFLGDPAENWTTAEIHADELPLVGQGVKSHELHYGPRGSSTLLPHTTIAEKLPFADTRQVIHRVVLRDLQPDTGYAFEIYRQGSPERLKYHKYFFKTAPVEPGEKLTFVTGGDMFKKRAPLDAMNRQASTHDPLFALLGGDLAYANGSDANRWYAWIDSWHNWCETKGDYMIPMVLVIGNHECSKEIKDVKPEELEKYEPAKNAKFFFSLFPLPHGVTNYALDFADYMSIICLDSNHTQKPEAQVDWLESALRERAHRPNLFACYHRPTYGAQVKDDEMEVRKHFVPLFDKYSVDAVFENDHHIYKRTMPLRKDEIHPDGTMYIGDGAWGVDTRKVPWEVTNKLDYVARAAKENHLIRVQLFPNRQQYDVFKANGLRIDSTLRFYR